MFAQIILPIQEPRATPLLDKTTLPIIVAQPTQTATTHISARFSSTHRQAIQNLNRATNTTAQATILIKDRVIHRVIRGQVPLVTPPRGLQHAQAAVQATTTREAPIHAQVAQATATQEVLTHAQAAVQAHLVQATHAQAVQAAAVQVLRDRAIHVQAAVPVLQDQVLLDRRAALHRVVLHQAVRQDRRVVVQVAVANYFTLQSRKNR